AHGAEVSTEDVNHKFLKSLPPAWSNLAMTMRTIPDVDTLSIDDLYNNLRVFQQELTSTSKSFVSAQNVAFVSHSKSSTNKVKSGYTGAYSNCTPTSSNNIQEREVHAGFVPRSVQLNAGRPNINSVRPNINTGRTNALILLGLLLILSNVNTGRTNVNPVRPRVNTGSFNVNIVRSRQPVPTKTSNNFSPKRPQVIIGSNCDSGPTFITTVNVKGPQGRPKPEKVWVPKRN
ncbi:hypothetical protein Tco_0107170, partial [Tanacetum coccineum]